MIFVYMMAFGIIGAVVFGPLGFIGGAGIGIVFAVTQSNQRRIRQLEKRLDEKENDS